MLEKQEIRPVKKVHGSVFMPGSKSITNRALVIGALSSGTTHLKNALFSDDTIYMEQALISFGIDISIDKLLYEFEVKGNAGKIESVSNPIYLGNSGTAMRFISSLVSLGMGEFTLTGDDRMHERPIADLVDALRMLGVNIQYLKNKGTPPILIKATGLNGSKIQMRGKLSSQYLSSILLSAPYAQNNDIEIEILDNIVSKPYIDLTINIMQDFGVECYRDDYRYFRIPKGQVYESRDYIIEGDASNASYFFAAAAITQGQVKVYNIDFNKTKQGDTDFVLLLEKMGCILKTGNNWIQITGTSKLNGIEVDMSNISDVAQTLAVVALFAKGKTIIKNIFNMRIKETDRIKALYNELSKLGAQVEEMDSALVITPREKYNGAEIETYNDHRMAMAFALAGLKIENIIIKNPICVAKTFPKYFDYLKMIC